MPERSLSRVLGSLIPRAAFGVTCLDASVAQATIERSVELAWTAPPECADEASVRASVARLAPSAEHRSSRLHVEGTVTRGRDTFVLDLVLQDGEASGRRRFEGDTCEEVVGAAAVSIALLLNAPSGEETIADGGSDESAESSVPTIAATGSGSLADGTTASDVGPDRPPGDDPEPHKESARSKPHATLLVPGLRSGFGLWSKPVFGPGAGLGVEYAGWHAMASGSWSLETRLPVTSGSDAGAQVRLASARLALCRWIHAGSPAVAPCASFAVQHLDAHGYGGGVASSDVSYTWAALGPQVVTRIPFTRAFALRAEVGLEVQLERPGLVIEQLGEVERSGAIEGAAMLGSEWIF
jgi:hypothetical protein